MPFVSSNASAVRLRFLPTPPTCSAIFGREPPMPPAAKPLRGLPRAHATGGVAREAKQRAAKAYRMCRADPRLALIADRLWSETLQYTENQNADRVAVMFLRTAVLLEILNDRRGWPQVIRGFKLRDGCRHRPEFRSACRYRDTVTRGPRRLRQRAAPARGCAFAAGPARGSVNAAVIAMRCSDQQCGPRSDRRTGMPMARSGGAVQAPAKQA
jgi:hypothetical protein